MRSFVNVISICYLLTKYVPTVVPLRCSRLDRRSRALESRESACADSRVSSKGCASNGHLRSSSARSVSLPAVIVAFTTRQTTNLECAVSSNSKLISNFELLALTEFQLAQVQSEAPLRTCKCLLLVSCSPELRMLITHLLIR